MASLLHQNGYSIFQPVEVNDNEDLMACDAIWVTGGTTVVFIPAVGNSPVSLDVSAFIVAPIRAKRILTGTDITGYLCYL